MASNEDIYKKEFTNLLELFNKLNNSYKDLNQKYTTLAATNSTLEVQLSFYKSQNAELITKNTKLTIEIAELTHKQTDDSIVIAELKDQLKKNPSEIADLKDQLKKNASEIADLKNLNNDLQLQIYGNNENDENDEKKNLEDFCSELQKDIAEIERKRNDAVAECRDLSDENKELITCFQNYVNWFDNFKAKCNNSPTNNDLVAMYKDLNDKLDSVSQWLDTLDQDGHSDEYVPSGMNTIEFNASAPAFIPSSPQDN
jgi:chromosome segregation ATPase